ncbi:MAG: glycerophosphodiester phosphodiesterase family protein [bacterium]|nr:glycerophosphodiester phosphodiesterase family protein [bacterium]
MSSTQHGSVVKLTPIFRIDLSSGGSRPLMIAHRCGAGLGPENTRGAVVQSSFYRPDYYEIDIRHTSDSVPVVFHDATCDRTTNLTGNISDLSWEEIKFADAGSWVGSAYRGESIPTFEQMLDGVNPSPLCIELKEPEISGSQCDALIGLLYERSDISSVIFSFHKSALDTFRLAWENFAPRLSETQPGRIPRISLEDFLNNKRRTCYLTISLNDYALEGPHEIVGILYGSCTEDVIEKIHTAGKACWVWTVDEPSDLSRFMNLDVDGIVTNYPDRLRGLLPPS